MTTHVVALMLWLTGLRPREVAAMTEGFDLGVDLINGVLVRFEGGAIGTVASTGSLQPGQDEQLAMRIYGSDGHMELDLSAGRAAIVRVGGPSEELEPLPEEERSPEWAPAQNLVDVILHGGANGSPSSIGVRTVELVEGMYRSQEERRTLSQVSPEG